MNGKLLKKLLKTQNRCVGITQTKVPGAKVISRMKWTNKIRMALTWGQGVRGRRGDLKKINAFV